MYALLVLPTSVALGLQMIGSFVGIVFSHFWCDYLFDSFLYMGHIMDHIVFSSVSILLSFSSTSSLHSNWDSLSQTKATWLAWETEVWFTWVAIRPANHVTVYESRSRQLLKISQSEPRPSIRICQPPISTRFHTETMSDGSNFPSAVQTKETTFGNEQFALAMQMASKKTNFYRG